ncbi:MAG: hypothetical protein E6Q56_08645 [Mycobacterium sp.]|nr:MAG: hypothetical protein E6Q56_08645 [Mycobacterium sp.]
MTNKFFLESDSEQLRRIHHWARARYAAPWAVFGAVLLRVAASVGPNVQLPGLIGGRASLNLLCAFVSPSGGGKGISDKVARLAWPTPIPELPIGSGEGIAAAFKKPDNADADHEPLTAAIFMVPEVDTLAGLASRQGSILLAQLKSMAMGEQLGQSNAQKATSRVVDAHSYRCCLSVGAQPGHCGVIFADTTGGTPQRFLWFPTTDPDMPGEPVHDPQPLSTSIPTWRAAADGVIEIGYGPEEIARTVIDAHLARQRGEADALDGHATLTRLKVAALLAVMHQRSVVSDTDWELSAVVMAVSDRTRGWIVEHARQAERAKTRARALSRAEFDETIDRRRLDTVRRRILKVLSEGRTARGDLRARLGKREYRELLEAATAELASEGAILRSEAPQGGLQFELHPEFSPEPQFSPRISSSKGLNPEFSPELSATVTDLQSRRSSDSASPRPTRTAAAFLAAYLAEHGDANGWCPVSQIYAAGTAEGYTRDAIKAARLKSTTPRFDSTNTGRNSLWRIATDTETTEPEQPDSKHDQEDESCA